MCSGGNTKGVAGSSLHKNTPHSSHQSGMRTDVARYSRDTAHLDHDKRLGKDEDRLSDLWDFRDGTTELPGCEQEKGRMSLKTIQRWAGLPSHSTPSLCLLLGFSGVCCCPRESGRQGHHLDGLKDRVSSR